MDSSRIPRHIAIVMDGNGRWAQRRGHPRVFGHIRGARRVKTVVREASQLGVGALTLYAFSTENWSRPETEQALLWKLLRKFLARETAELHTQGVRLRAIGEIDRLPADVRRALDESIAKLSRNTGLQLTLALSYGSRRELARAARMFAQDCVSGKSRPEELDETKMLDYLWTRELGPLAEVDLVIRTSGEMRTSNFLLWQAAYAEYEFLDLCWPDFGATELRAAVESYGRRERRFGGLAAKSRTPEPSAPSEPSEPSTPGAYR